MIFTHAARRSETSARAIDSACSSTPVVVRITLSLCGVRAGILAFYFAQQSFAKFLGSASILERLALVHEQDRHFDSEARLQIGVAIDFDSPDSRVEFRDFGRNNVFHLAAKLAVVSGVENQLDHELPAISRRIGGL